MRILLLTDNPVLALGLEAALLKAGHNSLLLCSTIAQLREQLAAAIEAGLVSPAVLVLDHTHEATKWHRHTRLRHARYCNAGMSLARPAGIYQSLTAQTDGFCAVFKRCKLTLIQ
jgi:hypothetical protein